MSQINRITETTAASQSSCLFSLNPPAQPSRSNLATNLGIPIRQSFVKNALNFVLCYVLLCKEEKKERQKKNNKKKSDE